MDFTTGNPDHDRNIRNLLPRFSRLNRATTLDYLRVRLLDSKPGTLYNYTNLLCLLDDHLNGADLRAVTRDQLLTFILAERQRTAQSTVVMRTRQLKRFLKDQLGKLPKEFEPVLRTKEPPSDRVNVVDHGRFAVLLDACNTLRRFRTLDRVAMAQAFLWFLWDTGFRIGEALSVRICGLKLTADSVVIKRGQAEQRLALRVLKAGPRTIEINECVPARKASLSVHPDPRSDSPFWVTMHARGKVMSGQTCDNLVTLSRERSAISLHGPSPSPATTSATPAPRAARTPAGSRRPCRSFTAGPGTA